MPHMPLPNKSVQIVRYVDDLTSLGRSMEAVGKTEKLGDRWTRDQRTKPNFKFKAEDEKIINWDYNFEVVNNYLDSNVNTENDTIHEITRIH